MASEAEFPGNLIPKSELAAGVSGDGGLPVGSDLSLSIGQRRSRPRRRSESGVADAASLGQVAEMLTLLKRHEIQVLRGAGHGQAEVATLSGVSERTVRRVEDEPRVAAVDDGAERTKRQMGGQRRRKRSGRCWFRS